VPETPEELYELVKDALRMPRPARTPQLIGSFAAIWDDILPPVPEEIWRANVDAVVAALEE
jgi:hypothetical protein